MRTLAIDTGSNGALSIYDNGKATTIKLSADKPADIIQHLNPHFVNMDDLDYVVIERPPYFMGTMIPSSRIAVLFECFGATLGFLHAKGLQGKIVEVSPQDWQRFIRDELGVKRGEMKHAEWKRHLTEYAKQKFPNEKLTGQLTDARLILDWWLRHGKTNPTFNKHKQLKLL
jgi:hypothetical protein